MINFQINNELLTAPTKLIELLAQTFPLHTMAPPFAIAHITVVQTGHERNQHDPGHHLFREKIRRILQTSVTAHRP